MWDFKLLKATQTLEKTMTYMIYRLAMYLLLSLVLLFGIVAGTGSGLILDSMGSSSQFLVRAGGILGLLIFSLILYWFRGPWFFSMRAPHIGLLNEAAEDALKQQGWAQVEYARELITRRFGNSAELFTLDRRIRAVLAHLFLKLNPIGQKLAGIERTPFSAVLFNIIEIPATYVHEVVISYCLKAQNRSASAAALTALNLYGRNFNRLFKNAVVLLLLKYAIVLIIYLAMLSPVDWIDDIFPVDFGNWRYIFAALLTWPIKSALFDPITIAAMITLFHELSQGQDEDPELHAKLAEDCPEFASLIRQSDFLESQSEAAEESENKAQNPLT